MTIEKLEVSAVVCKQGKGMVGRSAWGLQGFSKRACEKAANKLTKHTASLISQTAFSL